MSTPKVSVVMSCYNAEKTLCRAVDSILNQTFTSFEFVIVEDGSTDDTYEILVDYANQDRRIKVIKNPTNIGLAASLNKAIEKAVTPMIARMDADDEALPLRLQKQVSFLDENSDIDIVGSGIYPRTTKETVSNAMFLPEKHEDIVFRAFRKPMLYHPTIVARRHVFERYGFYNPRITWAEDADLWYRIFDKVKFHNLPEPLLYYTIKERLSFRQASYNIRVKYRNLEKRKLVWHYLPQLGKDILLMSFKMIKYSK